MRLSRQTIILTVFLAVVLFFIGMYTWNLWLVLILPKFADVIYLSSGFGNPFINSLLFSITLALIPVTTVLIFRYSPIYVTWRKILAVCVIIILMTASVLTRREMIISRAKSLQPTRVLDYSDPPKPHRKTIEYGIPLSTLKFELFAFAGLVVGGCVSFLFLSQPKR
jgi:hypothetical protein